MGCLFSPVSHLAKLHGPELADHRCRLLSGGPMAFLGMDRLQHQGYLPDLCGGHMAEDVAVPVDDAALPVSVRVSRAEQN